MPKCVIQSSKANHSKRKSKKVKLLHCAILLGIIRISQNTDYFCKATENNFENKYSLNKTLSLTSQGFSFSLSWPILINPFTISNV